MSNPRKPFLVFIAILLLSFSVLMFLDRMGYYNSDKSFQDYITPAIKVFNRQKINPDDYNVVMSYNDNCMIMNATGMILLKKPYELCIFLPDGRSFVSDGQVKLISAQGDILWSQNIRNHHGIDVDLHRGVFYGLSKRTIDYKGKSATPEGIVGFSENGSEVFRWEVHEFLQDIKTRLNSVHVIDNNSLTHPAFRPGNLLISSDYDTQLFIIDPKQRKIVWSYKMGVSTHEVRSAKMLPNGNILFFYNNYEDRVSSLIEINSLKKEVVWSYSAFNFFSNEGGSVSRLENGNTLFADVYHGGRATEISDDNRIVWQWKNPVPGSDLRSRDIYKIDRVSKADMESFFQNSIN